MIKETGRVVALQGGEVWVEAERESTCSKCSLQSGCGERLIGGALGIGRHRLVLDAGVDTNWSLDDHVEIGIPEVDLLKSAALAYLLPLLFLICGMLVLYRHYGEVGAIVGAIIGMLTGLVFCSCPNCICDRRPGKAQAITSIACIRSGTAGPMKFISESLCV